MAGPEKKSEEEVSDWRQFATEINTPEEYEDVGVYPEISEDTSDYDPETLKLDQDIGNEQLLEGYTLQAPTLWRAGRDAHKMYQSREDDEKGLVGALEDFEYSWDAQMGQQSRDLRQSPKDYIGGNVASTLLPDPVSAVSASAKLGGNPVRSAVKSLVSGERAQRWAEQGHVVKRLQRELSKAMATENRRKGKIAEIEGLLANDEMKQAQSATDLARARRAAGDTEADVSRVRAGAPRLTGEAGEKSEALRRAEALVRRREEELAKQAENVQAQKSALKVQSAAGKLDAQKVSRALERVDAKGGSPKKKLVDDANQLLRTYALNAIVPRSARMVAPARFAIRNRGEIASMLDDFAKSKGTSLAEIMKSAAPSTRTSAARAAPIAFESVYMALMEDPQSRHELEQFVRRKEAERRAKEIRGIDTRDPGRKLSEDLQSFPQVVGGF